MDRADGSIVIEAVLDDDGFSKGIAGIKKQTNGLQSVVSKLGKTIASAFAVRAIVNFSKECIELGSNIAEVQNVVDTAFGDMSYKVESFAETAIQNFGMSRLAAKKTASTYMAMAKGMGIADEAASDMAISLAGMTGDVASFYNISQELADVKLKSVFTGETETLKDLGIVMTQDNLKAYALANGITKSYDAMTQAEKVALRYNYVMDSLSLAQGDFAKTSDSWANQTRILSMQWQEFMSIVGQMLIAVLTPAVKMLNQVVSSLISVATAINEVVSSMFGTQQSVTGAISESVSEQDAMTEATKETAKAQKGLLAGFDEINKIGSGAGSDSGATATITPTKTPDVISTTAQAMESNRLMDLLHQLTEAVEPFRLAFVSAFWDIYETVEMVFTDLWSIVMLPAIQKWTNDIGPAMMGYGAQFSSTLGVLFDEAKGWFDRIWQEAITPALEQGARIWGDAWDSILAAWEKWGAPIFENLRLAIKNVSDTWKNIWETILKPVWDKFMDTVEELWTKHLKPFLDNFLDFVGLLVNSALEIYNGFIVPVVNWFVDNFGRQIVDTIGRLIENVGKFGGGLVDAASHIVDALSGLVNFITGVFTGDWERAWNGISEFFKGIVNGMIGIAESFVNFFIRGVNNIIAALNTISIDVPAGVPFIGGTKFGINIPSISEIKLPRLATGAVIPPNREFMAVLGDQNRGYNIEAPEDLIRKIVREESGGGMNTALLQAILNAIKEGKVLMVGRDEFAKLVYSSNQAESNRVGLSLTGG